MRRISHSPLSWHLRRVALVDYRGQIVFCTYVLPTNPVTDYRTSTTGIQASDLHPGAFDRACFHYTAVHPATRPEQTTRCPGKTSSSASHSSSWARLSWVTRSGKICQVSTCARRSACFGGACTDSFGSFSSVLGIRHPAVATRDVALYQPFRNALRSPNHVVGLQTLMWHLMRRRVQENHVCPVRPSPLCSRGGTGVLRKWCGQLENARASLDLYRSYSNEWEGAISTGQWPSHLPPSTFSRCYQ